MTRSAGFPFPSVLGYLVAIALLAILMALILGRLNLPWPGANILVTFVLAFVAAWIVLGRVAKSSQRMRLLDEKILQTQKLAAMGELAAGVAHEINNPLAIIRQEAEWVGQLIKKAELPETPQMAEIRDSLREIVQQVDRARDITGNLLNLARKREPVIQKVDLNRLILDMAALVEKEAKARNIQVIRRLQEDLPLIHSDGPLLRQVILNLLNNARQAIEGAGSITITTRLMEDGRVRITVADTGPGIPAEHLSRIFAPFFTTKPPGAGTGLGLAISQGIIHMLGGEMTAASRVGEGATFTFILPVKAEPGRFWVLGSYKYYSERKSRLNVALPPSAASELAGEIRGLYSHAA